MSVDSVLQFARRIAKSAVRPGDWVIDATVGQGYDTLALAEWVGEAGKVYGFDIQEAAIIVAKDRISAKLGFIHSLNWVHGSHEFMLEDVPTEWLGQVSAIMFNLGYLPGNSHQITTHSQSTITGLKAAVQLLRSGGVVTIVAYTGHEGAQEEADAVEAWASSLPQAQFSVLQYRFINQVNHPPVLIIVEKRS